MSGVIPECASSGIRDGATRLIENGNHGSFGIGTDNICMKFISLVVALGIIEQEIVRSLGGPDNVYMGVSELHPRYRGKPGNVRTPSRRGLSESRHIAQGVEQTVALQGRAEGVEGEKQRYGCGKCFAI